MAYITIEESKKLFERNDNPQEVIDGVWRNHWRNAKNANKVENLNNLLKNHMRLFNKLPERNNGKERENIIKFIQEKIKDLNNI